MKEANDTMIEGVIILLLVLALFFECFDERNEIDRFKYWDPPKGKI